MTKLTQDLVRSLFNYKDGNLYWKQYKQSNAKINDKAGSLHHSGYYQISVNNKTYLTHRLIFLYHYNYLPKYIDHIDGNPSNNKIENLREITLSQNNMNQKVQKRDKSSQYKGVSYNKLRNKWASYIKINNKQIHLGYFKSEIDAAITYNTKAIELFGEYTCLNEVE